jgi:amino acid transporter
MVALICTMFFLALWFIVTVGSQPPGTVEALYSFHQYFPLVHGYMTMFNISYSGGLVFCVIPCFGSALVMIYIISRQLYSMSSSGLLPAFLSTSPISSEANNHILTTQQKMLQIRTYGLICIAGYLAGILGLGVNKYVGNTQFATIAGCLVYIAMFWCYGVFKWRYSHMERTFRNPLGTFSACIGAFIFFIGFVFVLQFAVYFVYFSFITVMIIYYFCFVQSNQRFSASEQEVFFKAYVMKSKKILFSV